MYRVYRWGPLPANAFHHAYTLPATTTTRDVIVPTFRSISSSSPPSPLAVFSVTAFAPNHARARFSVSSTWFTFSLSLSLSHFFLFTPSSRVSRCEYQRTVKIDHGLMFTQQSAVLTDSNVPRVGGFWARAMNARGRLANSTNVNIRGLEEGSIDAATDPRALNILPVSATTSPHFPPLSLSLSLFLSIFISLSLSLPRSPSSRVSSPHLVPCSLWRFETPRLFAIHRSVLDVEGTRKPPAQTHKQSLWTNVSAIGDLSSLKVTTVDIAPSHSLRDERSRYYDRMMHSWMANECTSRSHVDQTLAHAHNNFSPSPLLFPPFAPFILPSSPQPHFQWLFLLSLAQMRLQCVCVCVADKYTPGENLYRKFYHGVPTSKNPFHLFLTRFFNRRARSLSPPSTYIPQLLPKTRFSQHTDGSPLLQTLIHQPPLAISLLSSASRSYWKTYQLVAQPNHCLRQVLFFHCKLHDDNIPFAHFSIFALTSPKNP